MNKSFHKHMFWLGAVALSTPFAQAQTLPEPANVVQVSASAQKEAVQDWLTMVLVTRQQAGDAASVQQQLQSVLEKALTRARVRAADKALQVSSGVFSVQPRYGKEGQIVGWQGSAELILQGQDVSRISSLAAELEGMSVSHMGFSLSPQAAKALESDVRQSAIANFRTTAQEVSKGFGFNTWTLREVNVQAAGDATMPVRQAFLRAPAAASMSAAPLSVEPGRSVVQVNVSGSIQLR